MNFCALSRCYETRRIGRGARRMHTCIKRAGNELVRFCITQEPRLSRSWSVHRPRPIAAIRTRLWPDPFSFQPFENYSLVLLRCANFQSLKLPLALLNDSKIIGHFQIVLPLYFFLFETIDFESLELDLYFIPVVNI